MGVNLLLAGGGTGGHVVPGVAVARAVERLDPGSRALVLGTGRPVEKRILDAAGLPSLALASAPATRSLHGLPGFALSNARGLVQAYRAARSFRADVCLGLGGYASAPGVLAARALGAPVALFEPNAVAGKANLFLARFAEEVYVHFVEAAQGLRAPAVPTGTPIARRSRARASLTKGEARRALGVAPDRPCLLIVGGSQGAGALNVWAHESLASVAPREAASVIHISGETDEVPLREAYSRAGIVRCVAAFVEEMGVAYRAADLVVCRGGAATLAEVCAEGLAAIVVPWPRAALDHQSANARALHAQGGCRVWAEERLTPASFQEALELAASPARLAPLAKGAREAGRPDAAEAVARRLLALAYAAKGTEYKPVEDADKGTRLATTTSVQAARRRLRRASGAA